MQYYVKFSYVITDQSLANLATTLKVTWGFFLVVPKGRIKNYKILYSCLMPFKIPESSIQSSYKPTSS